MFNICLLTYETEIPGIPRILLIDMWFDETKHLQYSKHSLLIF